MAQHQEQFGVKYLAQGHIDTRTGGAGNRTTDLPISGRPALPPEPQPPTTVSKIIWYGFIDVKMLHNTV